MPKKDVIKQIIDDLEKRGRLEDFLKSIEKDDICMKGGTLEYKNNLFKKNGKKNKLS
jgi:hypothetical protein